MASWCGHYGVITLAGGVLLTAGLNLQGVEW